MAQPIENAKKRLAEIEKEAEEIRLFIDLFDQFSDNSVSETVEKTAHKINPPARLRTDPRDSQAQKRGAKPAVVVPAAIEAMRDAGRPLTRSEVVKILEDQGMVIGGTDKNKNMGTVLWRSKMFESVEGEGYWPLELGPWSEYGL